MRATRQPIVGLPIARMSVEGAVEACAARARAQSGGVVCFVSLHTLVAADHDESFRRLIARSTFNFADGVPVLWLSWLKRDPVPVRIRGPELMPKLLSRLAELPHAFVGGAPHQAERIAHRYGIEALWSSPRYDARPDTSVFRAQAREDWATLVARCPAGAPPVCWVGLGCPKQESWMHAVAQDAPRTLFLGVGAAFDYLSGDKTRAPQLMQRAGFEWLHRLGSEPRRLWRRYLLGAPKLLRIASRDLRGGYLLSHSDRAHHIDEDARLS